MKKVKKTKRVIVRRKYFLTGVLLVANFSLIVFGLSTLLFRGQKSYAGLVVNTNTASLQAIRQLEITQRALSKSFERISSGLRIDSAADDAAGLGVAEEMKKRIQSAERITRDTESVLMIARTIGETLIKTDPIIVRLQQRVSVKTSMTDSQSSQVTADDLNDLRGTLKQLTSIRTSLPKTATVKALMPVIVSTQKAVNDTLQVALAVKVARTKATNNKSYQNTLSNARIVLPWADQKMANALREIDSQAKQEIERADDFMTDDTVNEYYEFSSPDEGSATDGSDVQEQEDAEINIDTDSSGTTNGTTE